MEGYRPFAALLCALLSAGCSSAQDGFVPRAPLRHIALTFDQGQWETVIEGRDEGDSTRLLIMGPERAVAIGFSEFESIKPTRMQAMVAQQLLDGLHTQFGSVEPAGPKLPARGLALPDGWTCDHRVVAKQPGSDQRAYTSCVQSSMTWFANMVVITPLDASDAEIEAANAVLSTLRTD